MPQVALCFPTTGSGPSLDESLRREIPEGRFSYGRGVRERQPFVHGMAAISPAVSSSSSPRASSAYPCRPIRVPSSIAAPATATVFLLVSLSKMPRGSNGAEVSECEESPEAFPIKANDFSPE